MARDQGHDRVPVLFGGLTIRWDDGVLEPRPWTIAQSRWGAELLAGLPDGRVLEVCAGAGHIGLAAVAGSGRDLVMIERSAHAAELAAANAEQIAERVEVRCVPMEEGVGELERFVLVLADPPWVRRGDVPRFPDDPVWAIDGGDDGLDLARTSLGVAGRALQPSGQLVLQVGDAAQAETLDDAAAAVGLRRRETREVEVDGTVRGALVRYERVG